MHTSKDLLGTVIYEHSHTNEQVLIIADLNSHQKVEYRLEGGQHIVHGAKRIAVSRLLSESSANNLASARMEQTNTSFILSPAEMEKAQQLNLTDF